MVIFARKKNVQNPFNEGGCRSLRDTDFRGEEHNHLYYINQKSFEKQ